MGRAMLIIVMGMLVALGYTFMGMSNQRQALTGQSVSKANKALAQNLSHTGIQFALKEFDEDNSWSGGKFNLEKGTVEVSINHDVTNEILEITSTANLAGASNDHTIIATYDISKNQQVVPKFQGALSSVSGSVSFSNSNPKSHYSGNEASGTCEDKPGLTVHDPNQVDDHDGDSRIEGDPAVAQSSEIKHDYLRNLIDRLVPLASSINHQSDFDNSTSDNPGIYTIDNKITISGQTKGYGILIVRNNAQLEIDADATLAGQFEFNGLVIFENETEFRAAGNATINGSIMAMSDYGQNLDITGNGEMIANYDCQAQEKYADAAVNQALNTTLYTPISMYE